MLLYLVESSDPNLVPLVSYNFSVVHSGVATGLQSYIFALCKISEAYYSCVSSNSPFVL